MKLETKSEIIEYLRKEHDINGEHIAVLAKTKDVYSIINVHKYLLNFHVYHSYVILAFNGIVFQFNKEDARKIWTHFIKNGWKYI